MTALIRLVRVFLLGSAILCSAQAAELRVPEPFDVLVVNGEDFGSSLRSTKSVSLKTGRNVVVLEYDQIFDAEFGDSHDRIRSAPFALVFDASADAVLTITDPQLKSGADAKRYSKSPIIQLRDQQQHDVAVQQVPVRETNGLLLADTSATSTPLGMPAQLSTSSMQSAAQAATHTTIQATTQTAAQANMQMPAPAATAAMPDALQMLNFWWQQASPEQRAAFLQSVKR